MSTSKPSTVDLSDLEGFWRAPIPERAAGFAALRDRPDLPWFEAPTVPIPDPGAGYYALTRYDDVVAASRAPGVFTSGLGATTLADLSPELLELLGSMMIHTDPPQHARLRRVVSRGFSPRRLSDLQTIIEHSAKTAVDDLLAAGQCDAVETLAARLPLTVICHMMGIPDGQHDFVYTRSNVLAGAGDRRYVADRGGSFPALLAAGRELAELMHDLGEQRRREPTDDVTSTLVHAEIDGESLTSEELASFFILLVSAGIETTRNAISWGLHLLTEHPDQRAAWLADLDTITPTAVEEILRWSSPIIYMRRTLAAPTVLAGTELPAGAKVAMFYWSANRDPAHFDRPEEFDVRRAPNPHLGFGGPGPHYCLGAHLARREISTLFTELLRRAPNFRTGAPRRQRSMYINGIVQMPITAEADTDASR
ncbi:cytochrome P450 [Nocardia sp. NPDC050175]|uniref:cytochrome P450 n=1 Tax=Nocardia sp. NPDC050175 TaxID=3364317 RepID=UPI0037AB8F3F